jgi:hypothetical protein
MAELKLYFCCNLFEMLYLKENLINLYFLINLNKSYVNDLRQPINIFPGNIIKVPVFYHGVKYDSFM